MKHKIIIMAAIIILAFSVHASAETVGVVLTNNVPFYKDMHNALMSKLSREGHDKRLKFIIQTPYPDPISWSNAARKLIALDVDAIITYGSAATLAAVREKPGIPIIFAGVYEPVALTLKAKNISGVASMTPVSSALRYLRGCGPITDIGVIYNSWEDDSVYQFSELRELASKYNFNVIGLNLKKSADITGLIPNSKLDALFITSASTANIAYPSILNTAKSRKIPTASLISHGDLHAIITLSADSRETGEMTAEKLIKMLDGEQPRGSPVHSKSLLIFNLREANNLGIKIPMNLVTEATEIIY